MGSLNRKKVVLLVEITLEGLEETCHLVFCPIGLRCSVSLLTCIRILRKQVHPRLIAILSSFLRTLVSFRFSIHAVLVSTGSNNL
jgi:hypothetical protein